MIKVALEVWSVYSMAILISAGGLFIFTAMIITLIRNWRDLMDE